MTSYTAMKKSTAQAKAKKARNMGYKASVYKKKKNWGVSVVRK